MLAKRATPALVLFEAAFVQLYVDCFGSKGSTYKWIETYIFDWYHWQKYADQDIPSYGNSH